jgi:DNA helicase-2/ATP-dependent DNA helicase PcrA
MSITYTPSQLQAIHHLDGNLQIIACAGSGKTQVLAQRIVNILKEKGPCGIGPENIVAFTFTNKAAAELKHRIHDLCEQQLGKVFGLAGMYVGTIHGFALALLQNHMFEFQKYSVLGDVQQRLLIDRFHQKSGLTDLQVKGKRLERWKDSQIYQRVLGIMREAGIIEANLGHDNPLKESVRKYEELLHSRCWLDFSMLLNKAVDALAKDASIREKMRRQVKYLIVDEYQDVNPLQERLISRLHDLGAQPWWMSPGLNHLQAGG